ncbi:MAG: type II secretion system F family protein [Thermoguttaceae bacterium]|jgi:tight adherence protein B
MSTLIIALATFFAVSCFVGAVAFAFRGGSATRAEDRLDLFTRIKSKREAVKESTLLAEPLGAIPGIADRFFNRFANFKLIFDQADTNLTLSRLLMISGIFALCGAGLGGALRVHFGLVPILGAFMALVPFCWLYIRRGRRLKAFGAQLPDAMELVARALRAGQSLPAGFSMVSTEMGDPIGKEFGRVFEEQNLGCSMEDSLRSLADRIPNTDLKFFVTAVVLQRQTGGDLAEILDKIGQLIRQRFQIWGQIQALTGEGRLSGIILMALPFFLFVVVYYLNPSYVMLLFDDSMGRQMLAIALFMQLLGALCIRKIVNIKV